MLKNQIQNLFPDGQKDARELVGDNGKALHGIVLVEETGKGSTWSCPGQGGFFSTFPNSFQKNLLDNLTFLPDLALDKVGFHIFPNFFGQFDFFTMILP